MANDKNKHNSKAEKLCNLIVIESSGVPKYTTGLTKVTKYKLKLKLNRS